MRTNNSIISILVASFIGIPVIACNTNAEAPAKVSVDKNVVVSIYPTIDKGDTIEIVSPCLMEETVHISELLHYPDDDSFTMPFNFSDTAKYAEITERNLDRRIAISLNGEVVSTPVARMKSEDGACSVALDEAQAKALFPNAMFK